MRNTSRGVVSVAELAEKWLAVYVPTARNPFNQGKARQRVRKYLDRFLGLKPLTKVHANDLRGYRIWLEKQDISPQTVKHVLSDARCMFGWAVDSGYMAQSPIPRCFNRAPSLV
jgi:hypothetical protein